jgi:DNA polymerase-3 subunit gamma/tau
VSIKNGSAVDVLEIDAASNRGIDDIRNIREKARLAPASLNQKVYIIDEVHQLTNDSFNALLKILEEPPKHVMFILCTTESAKVPATIQSRCVVINFVKANEEELVRALMRAAVGEGLDVEAGALAVLAKAVDGSFRST